MKNSRALQTAPTVNYVVGRIIDIVFENAKVATVTVTEKATGVLIQARRSSVDNAGNRRRGEQEPRDGKTRRCHETARDEAIYCYKATRGETAERSAMSDGDPRPESLRALIPGFSSKDQLDGLALHAIVRAADAEGAARLRDVAAYYRDDYLHALRMRAATPNAKPVASGRTKSAAI
jgi:hypothetical protein